MCRKAAVGKQERDEEEFGISLKEERLQEEDKYN